MSDKTKSPPGSFAKLMESQADSSSNSKSPAPSKKVKTKKIKATKKTRHHDTMTSRNHAVMTSSMTSRHHDVIIEVVRKSIKIIGKEPSTHRLTPEEKRAITDIIYTYKRKGTKTSENEIARIAINFLINEYNENGENSILHKVIKALNE